MKLLDQLLSSPKPHTTFNTLYYMGSYLPNYARHRIIQQGLEELQINIVEHQDQGFLPLRWLRLMKNARAIDVAAPLIIGEASNYLVPLLIDLHCRKRKFLFDPFVSLRDTMEDRYADWLLKYLSPIFEGIDRLNNWAASAVLLDTEQSRSYFIEHLGLDERKAFVVPVGAETALFHPQQPVNKVEQSGFHILFYGTFIPLQGIDIIIQAAAEVQRVTPDIHFHIVGDGQTKKEMVALARKLHTTNLTFGPQHVAYESLPMTIAMADICLGIFADRPKTKRVVPNKVYQAMAMGKAVITADTPAIRDSFSEHEVALIPAGDPLALANAILTLADNPQQRQSLGEAAYQAIQERYHPRVIAQMVLDICTKIYV